MSDPVFEVPVTLNLPDTRWECDLCGWTFTEPSLRRRSRMEVELTLNDHLLSHKPIDWLLHLRHAEKINRWLLAEARWWAEETWHFPENEFRPFPWESPEP